MQGLPKSDGKKILLKWCAQNYVRCSSKCCDGVLYELPRLSFRLADGPATRGLIQRHVSRASTGRMHFAPIKVVPIFAYTRLRQSPT